MSPFLRIRITWLPFALFEHHESIPQGRYLRLESAMHASFGVFKLGLPRHAQALACFITGRVQRNGSISIKIGPENPELDLLREFNAFSEKCC